MMSLPRFTSSLVVRSKRMLPADYVPGSFDVICARGADAHRHNQRFFRRTIQMHMCQLEQKEIVERIIDAIRQRSITGGFIRQDPSTGLYFEVGDFHARQKVSRALKEMLRQEGGGAGGPKRRKALRWGPSEVSSIELEEPSCYGDDNETDEEEITAPPLLNYQSSLSSCSTTTFEPDQFRMSKCSRDLMDDEDCSQVEKFFDIRRVSSSSLSLDNY